MSRYANATIGQLAQDAIEVQDACNLSGVVRSYADALARLRELRPDLGTGGINAHPVSVLFASKCAALACGECLCERAYASFSRAYDACKALALGEVLHPTGPSR